MMMVLGSRRSLAMPSEVDEVKEMGCPSPLEGEEKLVVILGKEFLSLPHSIGTSDALCRDSRPQFGNLTPRKRLLYLERAKSKYSRANPGA